MYSQETDGSYVTESTYSYTSNENSNIQDDDGFTFREDCFMRSSFLGCHHLYELSASAAMASASRYGDNVDPYEIVSEFSALYHPGTILYIKVNDEYHYDAAEYPVYSPIVIGISSMLMGE